MDVEAFQVCKTQPKSLLESPVQVPIHYIDEYGHVVDDNQIDVISMSRLTVESNAYVSVLNMIDQGPFVGQVTNYGVRDSTCFRSGDIIFGEFIDSSIWYDRTAFHDTWLSRAHPQQQITLYRDMALTVEYNQGFVSSCSYH